MLANTAPFFREWCRQYSSKWDKLVPLSGEKMVFVIFKKCNFLFKGIQKHHNKGLLQVIIKNKRNVSASLN